MSESEKKFYEMGKLAGQKANAPDAPETDVESQLLAENAYLKKQLESEREAFAEKIRKYKTRNRKSLARPLLGLTTASVLSTLIYIAGAECLVDPKLGEPLYRIALIAFGFFLGMVFERFKW